MQICEQGAKNLACAVIEQAAQDYQEAYRVLLRRPESRSVQSEIRELEGFLTSQRFELFAGLSGESISGRAMIQQLRRNAEAKWSRKG